MSIVVVLSRAIGCLGHVGGPQQARRDDRRACGLAHQFPAMKFVCCVYCFHLLRFSLALPRLLSLAFQPLPLTLSLPPPLSLFATTFSLSLSVGLCQYLSTPLPASLLCPSAFDGGATVLLFGMGLNGMCWNENETARTSNGTKTEWNGIRMWDGTNTKRL